ncbi:restriction endonuclease subunit S [Aliarcobacter cryaerophilus]|uniref:restriction endonuclease subunit S n=1 Tax=Aliarcobacter cryaerophilus TaxID=28198 RepID=UPI0021B1A1E0|nr:restriction endonuclease subunit S [Aliarcobacter cryaerophilus]MCT7506092.1 restriction endonuclease subunit S [Aliarcobacter cryaerophilus]
MLNLEYKEWKDFKIDILFKVNKGIYLKQDLIIKGDIPYITAKAVSNGLSEFIGNKKLFKKNSITVEKVKLTAFYQPIDYYCSHDVSVLENKVLNKENSLFICSMINRQGSKYSYGRQAQMNVVKRETLFCPINKSKEPDFEYMEEYSKSIINNKTEKYKQYAQKVLNGIEYKNIETLENKEWKEFKIYNIFSHQRGKRQIEANRKKGNIPYYSASQTNNGLTDFISNPTFKISTNAIIYSTFGDAYYVEKDFSTSDEITILTNSKLNKFNGLFISKSINQNKSKYSFGRKAFSNKIGKDKIMLPINDKKEPDFEYMEQYIKNLTFKKMKQYLDYLEKS